MESVSLLLRVCSPLAKTLLPFSFFFLGFMCFQETLAQTIPKYDMQFEYRKEGETKRDTSIPITLFKNWSKSASYPDYVKWKNQPFALKRNGNKQIHLYTDSLSSFGTGDTIGYAFIKIGATDMPEMDYLRSNIASFIRDSRNPNLETVLVKQGVLLKATQKILPDTELSISYSELKRLFPKNPDALKMQTW